MKQIEQKTDEVIQELLKEMERIYWEGFRKWYDEWWNASNDILNNNK